MNIFTKGISFLIALLIIAVGLGAQLTPFECDGTFYLSQYEWSNPQSGSELFEVNTQPEIQFKEVTSYNFPINGIGYNKIDGFIYAINPFNQNIYRIGKQGAFENLGHPSGMNDLSRAQSSGDISPEGEYVVTGKEKFIARLDIECDKAKLISQKVKTFTTNDSGVPTFGDIIFHPETGKCYGYEKNTRKMAEINPNTGNVSPFGQGNNINNIGALFWGENNVLYGYNDDNLYKIDIKSGVVTIVKSGPNSSSRDGCSCQVIEIEKSVDVSTKINNCDSLYRLSFNTSGLNNINSIEWYHNGNLLSHNDSTYFTSDAGTYVVQVVNQKYICRNQSTIYSDTIQVDPISPLDISTESILQPGCINHYGEVIVNASGGVAPYEFSIDDLFFSTENHFSQLNAGQYTFYVQDSVGCIDSIHISLTTDDNPEITSLNTQHTKCNQENGSISVNITSGSPPFQYSLNDAAFTNKSSFDSLSADNYTVIIKDANGCLDTATTVVKPSAAVSIDSILTASPYCDTSLINMHVYASSKNGNIQYALNNKSFHSTASFDSLSAGKYTIIVRDEEGCQDTASISLNYQHFSVEVKKFDTGCKAPLGIIEFNATGGHLPYEFSINNGDRYTETATFEELFVGSYIVIAQDSYGCEFRDTIAIQSQKPIEITTSVTPTRCNLPNGKVDIAVVNSSGAYSLLFDSMQIENNPVTGLSDGFHLISLVDSIGCTASDTAYIAPSLPLVVDSSFVKTNYCKLMNGKIEVYASSDTTPIFYTLNDSLLNNTGVFTALTSGDYSITMRDDLGCKDTLNIRLDKEAAFDIKINDLIAQECGIENGRIQFSVPEARKPFTVFLDGVQRIDNPIVNLKAASYKLRVEDDIGCVVDTLLSIESEDCPIYVPNAISPNGDGINDVLRSQTYVNYPVEVLYYRIYDRWGNLLYEKENFDLHSSGEWWNGIADGKKVNSGVYMYSINFLHVNSGKTERKKGDFTVLR